MGNIAYEYSHPIEFNSHELASEEWRDVPGWEEIYQISNLGRVKRKKRTIQCTRFRNNGIEECKQTIPELVRKPSLSFDGYCEIHLQQNDKYVNRNFYARVHRLVMITFRPDVYSDELEVNHINFNRQDNRLCNLEMCTKIDNQRWSRANHSWRPNTGSYLIVKDLSTGQLFDNVNLAAQSVGGNASNLIQAWHANRPYKGHVFIRTKDIPNDFDESDYVNSIMSKYRGPAKRNKSWDSNSKEKENKI